MLFLLSMRGLPGNPEAMVGLVVRLSAAGVPFVAGVWR